MQSSLTDPPDADLVEISIFGPGVGESVLVHLGAGKWIVIDSCKNGDGNIPALSYLKAIGANPATDVLLVVGTHAHDDHIAGIATVFAECESAEFVCSQALTKREFIVLTAEEEAYPHLLRVKRYSEYARVLNIVDERGRRETLKPLKRAISNRTLLEKSLSGVGSVRVKALSPSDEAVTRSLKAFAREKTRTIDQRSSRLDPNELAVALWLEIAEKRLLLGADLLNGPRHCGWSAVLAENSDQSRASVIKVPHHGSPGSHHESVWSELLDKQPLALLTPYRACRKPRPAAKDRKRLVGLTPHVYITASPSPPKAPRRIRDSVTALGSIARDVRLAEGTSGQVRARSRVGDSKWSIDLVSPARRLS